VHFTLLQFFGFDIVSESNFSPLTTWIMAGRGGRGALLEALLAQQQRPGDKSDAGADKSQVGKQCV
jgi:hypothetical protein